VTKDEAWKLANHWVAAWNAHDLDLIMTHYDDAVELTSPVAARPLEKPDGKVTGKANLRAYFQRGLEAYPELHFHLGGRPLWLE
jgi:ketosteroid isomerase-like protein